MSGGCGYGQPVVLQLGSAICLCGSKDVPQTNGGAETVLHRDPETGCWVVRAAGGAVERVGTENLLLIPQSGGGCSLAGSGRMAVAKLREQASTPDGGSPNKPAATGGFVAVPMLAGGTEGLEGLKDSELEARLSALQSKVSLLEREALQSKRTMEQIRGQLSGRTPRCPTDEDCHAATTASAYVSALCQERSTIKGIANAYVGGISRDVLYKLREAGRLPALNRSAA
eukprot:gnl/TRDRNA2_/TRDRNA2_93225_c0_seq1.p1 gnl/TRDRNA2_/TRDRNA2_93225_c0~~gnl/TRDRNA2_/TRDRNA2_93225_c0_seq1.p1  ORF type:complete len:228 (-),score=31.90 gnl/TRDRNA2_/TRDRNA2_93225_c0_seq1:210-893(-)